MDEGRPYWHHNDNKRVIDLIKSMVVEKNPVSSYFIQIL